MDQYAIIIFDKDIINPSISVDNCKQNIFNALDDVPTSKLFRFLHVCPQKRFIKIIQILENDDISHVNNYQGWQLYTTAENQGVLCLSPDDTADYLFNLADDLACPGSYILDVYWLISEDTSEPVKYAAVLNALKKLSKWDWAQLHIISENSLESANLYSSFLDIKNTQWVSSLKNYSIPWIEHVFWRGEFNTNSMSFTSPTFTFCFSKMYKTMPMKMTFRAV